MKKIIISVTNDLVTDHRVHKVCTTLHDAGYDVLLVGRKFRSGPPLSRAYRIFRMPLIFNTTALFFAEYNIRLFFLLLFSKADIFLSNDTDTLPANYVASVLRRKKLVFDAHEMFPELPEVVGRKFVKSSWTWIEDRIFPRLKYCYTVCASIAEIYNRRYGIQMQVVRNIPSSRVAAFEAKEIPAAGKSVLLYQGAVNLGRGIEWMIDAMPHLDEFVFFIAGKGDLLPEMQEKVRSMGLDDRVKFLGKIPLEDLPAYTKAADIGISLLENKGLNYYYSLPNRIFDFIRAEVPVLATDFPEIRKIVEGYHVGELTSSHDPLHLATLIRKIYEEKEVYATSFCRANEELCWENESVVLMQIVEKALFD